MTSKIELKARRPQPGVGLLGAAVLVSQLYQRRYLVGAFSMSLSDDNYFDKAYSPGSILKKAVGQVLSGYERAEACYDCGVDFDDHELEYDCEQCEDIYCGGCFRTDLRVCDTCYENADHCSSCESVILDGHSSWSCENCGVTCCDDCIHSGEWENYEYLCSGCYDDGVGQYADENRLDTTSPPWIDRGVRVQSLIHQIYEGEDEDVSEWGTRWKEIWGFDDADYDPAQAAADFYLLHPIQFNSLAPEPTTGLRVLAAEAKALRKELVARHDYAFRRYIDMVVGGELRHHSAILHEALDENRSYAWVGWKKIREAVGNDVLLDAAALFREFGGVDVSVGGENWAVVAECLHLRETGKLSPEVFVDRVFNLEHNGGAILSAKVQWSGFFRYNNEAIRRHIGPAHAAHPARLDILAIYASADAQRLWGEYVPLVNQERRRYGQRSIRRLPAREKKPSRAAWNRIDHDVSMATQFKTAVDEVRLHRGQPTGDGHHDFNATYRVLAERKKEGKLKPYDI